MKHSTRCVVFLLCIVITAVYAQGEIYDQPQFVFAASTYDPEQHRFSYGSIPHIQNHQSHLQPRYYTLDQHTITYLLSNNNHELVLSPGQEQLVLSLHHCYDNPQLLARIKALSEYPAYIKKLYTLHQSAHTRLGKAWNHFTGKVPKNIDKLYREVVANEAAAAQSQPSPVSKHQQKVCHYNPHAVANYLQQLPSNERTAKRNAALSRAIASHHQLMTKNYCIGREAEQLLEQCALPIDMGLMCIGDAYQHRIHEELIGTLDQAGVLYAHHTHNAVIHDLTMTLGECSYNGIIANQQHEVLLATQISDFCSAFIIGVW